MAISPVTAGALIDPTTFGNAVVDELNNRGVKGIAKTSGSDQSGISALTDITGLSVTWTADPSRTYKTTVNVNLSKATSDAVALAIRNAASSTLIVRSAYIIDGQIQTLQIVWTETGLSGSTTRKASVSATSGTVSVTNGFSRNGILIVEDIGPA